MMLGFLLARAGVDVIVLEKHADFLRDFRGDTIHPSTLEVIYELGLLEEFLKRPHQEIREFAGQIGDELIPLADLTHLPTHCKFLGFMPQWDFLDFLADEARSYPAFKLMMNAEVTDLLEAGNKIVGVKVSTPEGDLEIRAELTVGCDGRKSIVREQAGLLVESLGAPIDVLWFRLSRKPGDPGQVLGRFVTAKIMVMLNREDYWQCAFVIPKGAAEEIKRRGLEAFRADIVAIAPFLKDRVAELQDWDQVKLLTVLVDRLRKWYRPGLLVHWRRGARDVAGRRCRHQPGDSGCGRHGQHSRAAAVSGSRFHELLAEGAMAARISHEGHSVGTGAGAGKDSEAGARQQSESSGPVVLTAFQEVSAVKENTGAFDRNWE
jgi:2-polyprenyl-6-methoxyphenol hydroxylase-like FAD-dependent oxidoreductase